MNNKVLRKIIVIAIALIAIYMPKCFATSASISASETSAKPGDTVEMYIDLTTPSIGYDLQISTDNSGLISASQVVNKIGSGNTSRIYLVQLASSSDRITHPSGTRIATIKYTIAETAAPGSKITLKVAGNVAGASSSDKNTMNESITISIVAPQSTDEKTEEELPKTEGGNEGTEEEIPKEEQPKEEVKVPEEDGKADGTGQENPPKEAGKVSEESKEEAAGKENTPEESEKEENVGQENQPKEEEKVEEVAQEKLEQPNVTKKEEKDDTTAKVILPAAGVKGIAIIAVTALIIVLFNSFKKYYKNRDIK